MKERLNKILADHVPPAAVNYCVHLWEQHPFSFRLSRGRRTKFGDYKYLPDKKQHVISVNHTLNPYAFLITYVHEVAHLVAFTRHGKSILPHGTEWKRAFKTLFQPALNEEVFPQDLLKVLNRYLINPKASSYSDPRLALTLQKYDPLPDDVIALAALRPGDRFVLQSRTFEKQALRRTRIVCKELKSGRQYLISQTVLVKRLEN